jgi:uncharacterized protein (TIGR00288 family)
MQEKQNIAVFVDYDNIEIGVKSTLRREFDVALTLDALKERGDIVAKFAYANWSRQEGATRQMAENAVQMVQRIPSPRGDKNGADINLALDALEMAFTHSHVNAFAIISGDSDFIPLVNKLREFGKTIYVVGGKAFTSTILQQNCHEFISYESLLDEPHQKQQASRQQSDRQPRQQHERRQDQPQQQGPQPQGQQQPQQQSQQQPSHQQHRQRPAPLDLAQAMPLVERALQALERRGVQPQLGLLKSTMLQLDSAFSEKAYGASSFSDFVDKMKKSDFVEVSGTEGRYTIRKKGMGVGAERAALNPHDALPGLRDVLETHRLEMESGVPADELANWMQIEQPAFDNKAYGFQEFNEFLNYAQDKLVVRMEPDEEKGMTVYLGAEFYPPAAPIAEIVPQTEEEEEEEEKQPFVEGQPSMMEPEPKPKKAPAARKKRSGPPTTKRSGSSGRAPRKQGSSRAKKPMHGPMGPYEV